MDKKHFRKILIFSALIISMTNNSFAQALDSAFSPLNTTNSDSNYVQNYTSSGEIKIDLNKTSDNYKKINITANDTFYYFENATDRFVQSNIRASWDDFKKLISNTDNDFMYMSYANKLADLGFFDLATLSSSKIKDKDISGLSMDAMKRFYFPRRKLKLEDEFLLAEAYSNILYNNQSSEATNELLKNETLLSNSDYANYMVALGSYKSNIFKRAGKYINIAIIQNPANLNYQVLKAKILAEENEPLEALKTVDNLKKQNLYSYEYERKIKSLEQFVLYKIKKNEWEKDYHLAYYYYYENDSSKAIKSLQSALSAKKRANTGMIYGLMSEVYLSMDEFEKAADTAKKACRADKSNQKALITLGDLSYRDKNYKLALEYYKKAANQDKKAYIALVKEAQAYQMLSNIKKAEEIYTKVLKNHSDSWEAYYNVALLDKAKDKEKSAIYLKKALAVNPLYESAWIELAKAEIEKGNYDTAGKYLSNAFYIDENDFRYYYYQGLVNANTGDFSQAEFNFKKCLKLNANCADAQSALDSVLSSPTNGQTNSQTVNLKQDNI